MSALAPAGPQPADAGFERYAPAFDAVLGDGPRIECVAEVAAHEGPVYVRAEDALYFTTVPQRPGRPDMPQVDVARIALQGARFPVSSAAVTTVRPAANVANGMTLDAEGRLVVCEQGTFREPARISRLDPRTGASETLVERCGGLPLNSPNDVVVKSDGTVWFTDPSYGHLQGFRPPPRVPDAVYRYDPGSGQLEVAAVGFDKPNGLAFSPDEGVLYVGDNGAPHHLLAFDVRSDGSLGRRRVVAGSAGEHPDGLKVDSEGRIYASAPTGVRVHAPGGRLLGEIAVPGAVNFTFGGREGNVLFITADTAVWAATLAARGAVPGHDERSSR
jgi:gluconolactonase